MASVLSQTVAQDVELHDNWLRVHFPGPEAAHADFHYIWLRHNCDQDRHPQTGERTVCPSELPQGLKALRAGVDHDAGTLWVAWDTADKRVSTYSLEWLRGHAYALNREEVPPPPSDPERVSIYVDGAKIESLVPALLRTVDEQGLVVVRGYGLDTEALIVAIEAAGLQVRPTHFGRIEDLRTDNTTNQNTDQLGYTNYPVKLHTDQPFLEEPPQYQLLQSMRKAETGGENYLVDALAAARYIESIDRQAYELLSQLPVRFHRKQKNFEKVLDAPLLEFKADGKFQIRYSYFTLAPFNYPFDLVENWYRAYNTFANLVNDPRNQYSVALEPGDFVLYDNKRMLHARNGFTGARWNRGIYFDRV